MVRTLPARARDWLDAADPGAVRRTHGARTVLAALATFATLQLAKTILGGPDIVGFVVYGVLAAFVCALAVTDPRRRDRAISLAWCVPALAIAVSLAALAEPVRFLPSIVLLVLIFLAFAARRAGLRAGELVVVVTMGTYFASSLRPALADVPWLAVSAAVGVAWLALAELVLLPYDPVRSIRRAARAYAGRIAGIVSGVATLLASPGHDGTETSTLRGTTNQSAHLSRALRLAQLNRRVIEGQFPGARAPGGWTADELTRLQVALYEAELGVSQMVDGCGDRAAMDAIPIPVRGALASTLEAIAEALGDVIDQRHLETLVGRADELRDRVMEAVEDGRAEEVGQAAPPDWVVSGLRIANGARRVARAIVAVRALGAIEASRVEPGPGALASTPGAPASSRSGSTGTAGPPGAGMGRAGARAPAAPSVRLGPMSLHLTTALGLQAVIATCLSMALAWIAGVEHPNWVFWTSFVVIAGSLDESLRRLMHRVAGTVAGVVIGVFVAILLPRDLAWVIPMASVAVFLAIYVAPVSHAWFVLWLNVAFVLVYASPGGSLVELLVQRPLMTAIGAAIAALIVVRVLPISRSGRYTAALLAFLASIRAAVRQWTDDAGSMTGDSPLPAVDAAYRSLEALSGARELASPFRAVGQATDPAETEVAALIVAMTRLGAVVDVEPAAARRPLPAAVGARIGHNLDATMSLAGGTPATLTPTLDDLLAPVGSQVFGPPSRSLPGTPGDGGQLDQGGGRRSGGFALAALADVHACVVRLGATLGEHRDGERHQPPMRP